MAQKLLLLALAGALGTIARYGIAGFIPRIDSSPFPWGTFIVNVMGCFIVGLLWTLFESRWPVSSVVRLIVLVGFMGAFTTFSALMLETNELLNSSAWMYAAGNVIMSNAFGFIALLSGVSLGRMI